jgi:hypothetical protein
MEEQLKQALSEAINGFNNKRAAILQLANTNGGQDAITNAEEQFDALRNAYFQILQKQLDNNNADYQQLITAANTETDKLNNSITQLNNINDIIELTTAVASLVGRIAAMA